ncbi:MAG: glycosyltransferase, partial [Saprospiraceae bacterium]
MQNKPKTVALVANTSWNIHNFRLNLIKVLEENGYQVVVIAPTDKYISYREKFPKVKHYGLRQLNRKSLNPIREIKLVKEMVNVYKKADADVYIQYTIKPNIFGSIAARLADKKCISIITGLGYTFINNGYINKIAKILYRIALKNNSRVIFENQEDRLLFLRSKLTEDKKAVSIKGCGVDTEYFSPMPKKRTSDELVFTFIGRLLIDKGVKEFVEAAKLIVAKHKNIRFWVVGEIDADNPAMIKKQDLVAWTDSKVIEYKGFYDDVRQVIRDSDCIVLPS